MKLMHWSKTSPIVITKSLHAEDPSAPNYDMETKETYPEEPLILV